MMSCCALGLLKKYSVIIKIRLPQHTLHTFLFTSTRRRKFECSTLESPPVSRGGEFRAKGPETDFGRRFECARLINAHESRANSSINSTTP